MRDRLVHELRPQCPDKRTKASIILLASAVAVVLLDIAILMLMMTARPSADSILWRLGDEIAAVVLLSVPLVAALSAIGALLGMLEWNAAGKASRRPRLMTVAAVCLNLALLVVVLIVGCFLWTFEPYVGG